MTQQVAAAFVDMNEFATEERAAMVSVAVCVKVC